MNPIIFEHLNNKSIEIIQNNKNNKNKGNIFKKLVNSKKKSNNITLIKQIESLLSTNKKVKNHESPSLILKQVIKNIIENSNNNKVAIKNKIPTSINSRKNEFVEKITVRNNNAINTSIKINEIPQIETKQSSIELSNTKDLIYNKVVNNNNNNETKKITKTIKDYIKNITTRIINNSDNNDNDSKIIVVNENKKIINQNPKNKNNKIRIPNSKFYKNKLKTPQNNKHRKIADSVQINDNNHKNDNDVEVKGLSTLIIRRSNNNNNTEPIVYNNNNNNNNINQKNAKIKDNLNDILNIKSRINLNKPQTEKNILYGSGQKSKTSQKLSRNAKVLSPNLLFESRKSIKVPIKFKKIEFNFDSSKSKKSIAKSDLLTLNNILNFEETPNTKTKNFISTKYNNLKLKIFNQKIIKNTVIKADKILNVKELKDNTSSNSIILVNKKFKNLGIIIIIDKIKTQNNKSFDIDSHALENSKGINAIIIHPFIIEKNTQNNNLKINIRSFPKTKDILNQRYNNQTNIKDYTRSIKEKSNILNNFVRNIEKNMKNNNSEINLKFIFEKKNHQIQTNKYNNVKPTVSEDFKKVQAKKLYQIPIDKVKTNNNSDSSIQNNSISTKLQLNFDTHNKNIENIYKKIMELTNNKNYVKETAIINLEHPAFGRLEINLEKLENEVIIKFVFENNESKEIIEKGLNNLRERLTNIGLEVKEYNLEVKEQDSEMYKDDVYEQHKREQQESKKRQKRWVNNNDDDELGTNE